MTFDGLANHLFQSTLFGVAVSLLLPLFRENSARVRYVLWVAASVKFLIPFSLFIALGTQIDWPVISIPPAVLLKISQPLVSAARGQVVVRSTFPIKVDQPFPLAAITLGLWLAGFAVVSVSRLIRWRQIAIVGRCATRLQTGREVDAVLRLRKALGVKARIDVRLSAGLLEPGTFGIMRPVLLLPRGISELLPDTQFEAIVTHELSHIRRRDNLTAAIHMVVESFFWFHPLVWWIGSRLIETREHACDESVVEFGADPETYARAILNACRFYVRSAVPCVTGVTGANLTRRIERIMTHRVADKLNVSKKLLLTVAGVSAIAAPLLVGVVDSPRLYGQSSTPRLSFEAASIRPAKAVDFRGGGIQFLPGGRFVATNVPVMMLVAVAYDVGLQSQRLSSAAHLKIPDDRYDIEATAEKSTLAPGLPAKVRNQRIKLMLQTLLEDRFKLKIRREPREQPVYALVVGKGGPKLRKSALQEIDCGEGSFSIFNPESCHGVGGGMGRGILANAATIADVALFVQNWTDRPVVDKTGLTDLFDIQTEGWAPMRIRVPNPNGAPTGGDAAIDDPDRQTLFDVFERLGLRMERQRAVVDMFVVESIERPSEN